MAVFLFDCDVAVATTSELCTRRQALQQGVRSTCTPGLLSHVGSGGDATHRPVVKYWKYNKHTIRLVPVAKQLNTPSSVQSLKYRFCFIAGGLVPTLFSESSRLSTSIDQMDKR